MGLIATIKKKLTYTWPWRIRYWWYDTPAGAHAKRLLLGIALLAIVINSVEAFMVARAPGPHPQHAIVWIVVWLIIALIVGVAVALSMHGNNQPPPDQQANGPTTQDGRAASRFYGTCCIKAPAELGWKIVGKVAIKSDGGGK